MSDRSAYAAAPAEELPQQQTAVTPVAEAPPESGDALRELTLPARQEEARPEVPSAAGPSPPSPDPQLLAERIGRANLPPGLKTRLAEVAAAGGGVEETLQAVEEALPGVLRITAQDAIRPAHPAGEVFFHGDAEAISDHEAEAIARGQLARSGHLRGQRVRVAD